MAHRLGRRFIALVAADALSLNALLAPFAVPASAGVTAWAYICNSADHSQSPSGDKLPVEHQSCPMGNCSLAGCGPLVALGDVRQVESLFIPGPGKPFSLLRWQVGAPLRHSSSPHLARAPPAA
jgi:hypothetical protein